MTKEQHDGGPAFPAKVLTGRQVMPHGLNYTVDEKIEVAGMSLRDYFAAKAMQGFVAGQDGGWQFEPPEPISATVAADIALSSYRIADAMLKARNA